MSEKANLSEYTLYYSQDILDARTALACLVEKGVTTPNQRMIDTYGSEDLKPIFGDTYLPDHLAILEHKGIATTGSYNIAKYLDRQIAQNTLVPKSDDAVSIHNEWVQKAADLPVQAFFLASQNTVKKRGMLESFEKRLKQIENVMAKDPKNKALWQEKASYARHVINILSADVGHINTYATPFFDAMKDLEHALFSRDYLCGSDIYYVDILWASVLQAMSVMGQAKMWQGGKFPRVSIFFNKMQKRPGMSADLKEHAHYDTVKLFAKGGLFMLREKIKSIEEMRKKET